MDGEGLGKFINGLPNAMKSSLLETFRGLRRGIVLRNSPIDASECNTALLEDGRLTLMKKYYHFCKIYFGRLGCMEIH